MTKNEIKAHALKASGEALLMGTTVTIALSVFHLLAPINEDVAALTGIVIAFGVHNVLAPMLTAVFGPAIDRLRGKTTDTATTS
jgi:hypothetical protein